MKLSFVTHPGPGHRSPRTQDGELDEKYQFSVDEEGRPEIVLTRENLG